ncbi:MAG TPA: CidA/LrgA family protein [Bacteroidales bacterium]|jgi:holin-like protein|nr:CidA/LrgA family protein [Sphaerochaeta sp.]HQB52645.1 CidA/LrgA family protein [Bacteroidales bacterium]
MRHLKQLLIILSISFAGEILSQYIPLGIPASIYGMVIMFTLLYAGSLKLENVKEVGDFLVGIMGIMFVPATVGIIDCWDVFSKSIWLYLIVIVVTTIVVMVVSGLVTQAIGRIEKRRGEGRDEA